MKTFWISVVIFSLAAIVIFNGLESYVKSRDHQVLSTAIATTKSATTEQPVMYANVGNQIVPLTQKDLDDADVKKAAEDKARFDAYHKTSGFSKDNEEFLTNYFLNRLEYLMKDDYAANEAAPLPPDKITYLKNSDEGQTNIMHCFFKKVIDDRSYDNVSLTYWNSGDVDWGIRGHYHDDSPQLIAYVGAANKIRTNLSICIAQITNVKIRWTPNSNQNLEEDSAKVFE